METCVVCNAPLKLIPPGVSKKTGNPYPAFYACPEGHRQPPVTPAKASAYNPPSQQSFERGLIDNSRQNSIIRQHSQTTALMALELKFKVNPQEVKDEILTTGFIATIRAYTDMFDADAKSTAEE